MGDKNLQDLKGKSVVVYDDHDHEVNQERIQHQFQYFIAPGFKFLPSDDELVFIYLKSKTQDPEGFQPPFIPEMNVYDYLPHELLDENEDKDAYFFTPRNKRYENGSRAARSVKGAAVKNNLRFFQDRSKTNGTDWQMKEFVVCSDEKEKAGCSSSMKLDDWVLTHIYLKKNGGD
ncbi:hypothetical protein MKX03_031731 [Papaver bracteatum]|nr:hypothetical protein MKX03_031731 [Papaver bracteatum]